MERDNFYILLELSVEPPETDDTVIYNAIQKKKAEWSRLRNHPTKGIHAQKYISMIPDIQRVMMNQEMRHAEALDAIDILKKGKQDKYVEIDRHIDILIGKGYLLDEEITKLANIHGIEPGDIKTRINAKKETQYQKVDQTIGLRMEKGYITEAEIDKIAARYALTTEEVRRRIRCPIAKDDKEKIAKPPPLDKSIERAIIENLKVVQKSSLYDFLELPETAELEKLQEKATQKKKDLTSFSRKDADITAGNILAGQCLTIFKNNESRNAYDISLAKAKLASLHSDIDVAAIGGNIRLDYFNILVSKAMDFGMDLEEAEAYVKNYCGEKKYSIEKIKAKKKPRLIGAVSAAIIALAVIITGISFYIVQDKRTDAAEYRELLAQVESEPAPEKKIALLNAYADAHKSGDQVTDAKARIAQIASETTAREFEKIEKRAKKFIENNELEQARLIYQEFHDSQKPGETRQRAADQIQKLTEQIENRDYERIMQLMTAGESDDKIAAMQQYLEDHPAGTRRDEVNKYIQDMSAEYFIFIQKQLDACERNDDWPECITLCRAFIKLYDNSYADQLKTKLPVYEERARYNKIFEGLMQKAQQFDTDYAAAREIFTDFLTAYPNVPIRAAIEAEVAKLDRMAAAQATAKKMAAMRDLLKKSGRFAEHREGVVIDTKTRLMWCLLDARAVLPETCINYEAAKAFVGNLSTGGYRDWRMPTAAELDKIYKTSPAFPLSADNDWYWTSEYFTSYSDGWHIKVNTLGRENQAEWVARHRDAMECGNVRAVRGP